MKDYESKKSRKSAVKPSSLLKNGCKNMIRTMAIQMDTFDMKEENVTVSQKQRITGKY